MVDALQIISATRANSATLVTGDKKLATIAEVEGSKVLRIS